MTALYPTIVYGPVRSRRLGVSLGVNLLPLQAKVCTFDCIYCECGWNGDNNGSRRFNGREEVSAALQSVLETMAAEGQQLDVITFAGNGEPTMHPDFEQIIDDTIALRDQYAPTAKISVLSNATQLHRADVVRALERVDNNILKIDSLDESVAQLINKPCCNYSVAKVVEQLRQFNGRVIVQTMFLRGEYNGKVVDNTTEDQIAAWLNALKLIEPQSVMVYSIARDTPCKSLIKVEKAELEQIAERVRNLGIECTSS
ncbi:MAG: radical SAM protein [Alistipes sp.]|nr:radical SAM protein [Alistipes sp.]